MAQLLIGIGMPIYRLPWNGIDRSGIISMGAPWAAFKTVGPVRRFRGDSNRWPGAAI
jgi:hypothetical protein